MAKENDSKDELVGNSFVYRKLQFLSERPAVVLLIIGGIALFLRLYYFPYNLPLTLDALAYFWYANDMSILGHFPSIHNVGNTGWPDFLSIFFSAFHSSNFLDYMLLQRLITVGISTITIIPVYFLCRKFFGSAYSIVGASIFAFEPRIIQNSVLGITDPLYIFLGASALSLFLSSNKKAVYSSFAVAALCTLVRSEGLFLFFVMSIMYFVRFRKEHMVIPRYLIALAIFVLIMLPVTIARIPATGSDDVFMRLTGESKQFSSYVAQGHGGSSGITYLAKGAENFVKLLGWSSIPIFIFFVPYGIFLVLKNRNHNNWTLILTIIFMFMPAFYALSLFSDTRYFYFLYPVFCVVSLFAIRSYSDRFRKPKIFLALLLGGILFSSVAFLEIKKMDFEHEREAYKLAFYVANMTKVINGYQPESQYLKIVAIKELPHFPTLSSDVSTEPVQTLSFDPNPVTQNPLFSSSLEEAIMKGKKDGLTHLVLDGEKTRQSYFNDVFYHKDKYPYLVKVFDSWDYGYKYHLKIYKIDYNMFDSIAK